MSSRADLARTAFLSLTLAGRGGARLLTERWQQLGSLAAIRLPRSLTRSEATAGWSTTART